MWYVYVVHRVMRRCNSLCLLRYCTTLICPIHRMHHTVYVLYIGYIQGDAVLHQTRYRVVVNHHIDRVVIYVGWWWEYVCCI